jgi:hypothetical protein
MAFNHAQRRAGLLSVYLWAVTIGLAGFAAAASGFSGALGWVLPVLALALLVCGLSMHLWQRFHPLPPHRRLTSSRAPMTLRGAVLASALLGFGAFAVLAVALLGTEDSPTGVAAGLVGAALLVVTVSAQLIVPAWHTEHARSLFRDFIRRHDAVRAELEHLARSDDGRGPFAFGPL